MPVAAWYTDPALNGDADLASGIDFREGVVKTGTINNSFRAMMAEIKKDLASSVGSQKLPGGLILKWGTTIIPSASDTTITFAIPFPTSCFNVVVTPLYPNVGTNYNYIVSNIVDANVTKTSFRVQTGLSQSNAIPVLAGSHSISWEAIGR